MRIEVFLTLWNGLTYNGVPIPIVLTPNLYQLHKALIKKTRVYVLTVSSSFIYDRFACIKRSCANTAQGSFFVIEPRSYVHAFEWQFSLDVGLFFRHSGIVDPTGFLFNVVSGHIGSACDKIIGKVCIETTVDGIFIEPYTND